MTASPLSCRVKLDSSPHSFKLGLRRMQRFDARRWASQSRFPSTTASWNEFWLCCLVESSELVWQLASTQITRLIERLICFYGFKRKPPTAERSNFYERAGNLREERHCRFDVKHENEGFSPAAVKKKKKKQLDGVERSELGFYLQAECNLSRSWKKSFGSAFRCTASRSSCRRGGGKRGYKTPGQEGSEVRRVRRKRIAWKWSKITGGYKKDGADWFVLT